MSTRRTVRRAGALVSAVGLAVPLCVVTAAATGAATTSTPDVARLAGDLSSQTLVWEPCDFYMSEEWEPMPNLACATVKVPRDWHHPQNGKTWDIRISQIKNVDPQDESYRGTIFGNPGGPGSSGLNRSAKLRHALPELKSSHNYVGFDPRGTGDSSAPTCAVTFDPNDPDPYAKHRAIAEQCASDPDIKTINTEQTAYDMDFIRHLLGAPKLSYVGVSYGTWLGSWYSRVFSANAGTMVLDSAMDVTAPHQQGTFQFQPMSRDRQMAKHLMNWIARKDATYGLGTDPENILQRWLAAIAYVDEHDLPLDSGVLSAAFAVMDNHSWRFADTAERISKYILAAEAHEDGRGNRSGAEGASPAIQWKEVLLRQAKDPNLSPESRATLRRKAAGLGQLAEPGPDPRAATEQTVTKEWNDSGDMIRCNDGQYSQGEAWWESYIARTADQTPLSTFLGSNDVPVCAFWKTDNQMPKADAKTYPKTLVLHSELDSQTWLEGGLNTALKLPNTKAIFIDNEGSHAVFPYGTECVDRPVVDFFRTGTLAGPNSKTCQALPLPEESTTYESWGRLNPRGQHISTTTGAFEVAPDVPGPRSEKRRGAATELDPHLLDQVLEGLIRAEYGPRGLETARDAKVIP